MSADDLLGGGDGFGPGDLWGWVGPGFMVAAIVLALLYSLPTIVAFSRCHPNRWVILALNGVLGATIIVWVGCLVWALDLVHLPDRRTGLKGGPDARAGRAGDKATAVADFGADMTGAPDMTTARKGDVLAEIDRLSRLHAEGHLDAGEFAGLKAVALKRALTAKAA